MNRCVILMFSIFIISSISSMSTLIYADEINYCHDKESWKEWEDLIEKYPHNMDIQMLHAVRIGFCRKIGDGSITFEAANKAFNRLHEMVIKRAKETKKQGSKEQPL